MSATQLDDVDPDRRRFLRIAAGTGTVGVGTQFLPNGPVQESEAILPAVVAGGAAAKATAGAAGGGAVLGWALREFEIIGADDPPEGETPESLQNSVYNRMRDRESVNRSTILDNRDIMDGIKDSAFRDSKLAAIDAINDEQQQSAVESAALDDKDDRLSTIIHNLIKSWNESVDLVYTLISAVLNHGDLSGAHVFGPSFDSSNSSMSSIDNVETHTIDYTLPDGNVVDLSALEWAINFSVDGSSYTTDQQLDLTDLDDSSSLRMLVRVRQPHVDDPNYADVLDVNLWADILSDLENISDNLTEQIEMYVDKTYGLVQSGEIDTADLLTSTELSELTTEDEDFPQAIADLKALNIPIDLEREAEVYLPDIDATVWGQLGYSGEDTLETGTINPDDKDGSIYLTYDVSEGAGEWSAHQEGIDGGVLTFTQEPFIDTLYVVHTSAGETAEVTADEFEDSDGDEWTVDLSDQLDDAITNVEQIDYYAESEETQFETVQLQDVFEIVTFEDSDGNEHESADFERSEPHTDDNYITEEEWQAQQDRHEELIEKYEDAQGSGIGFLDGEEIPAEGVVLIILAVFAALFGR